MNITNAARKKVLMSHYVGEEVDNIIDTLVIPAPAGDANKYTVFREWVQTKYTSKPKQQPWKGKEKQSQPCRRCGNPHGGDIKNCPAYGQTCNHYAKHCKTPPQDAEAKKKPSRWGRRRHARVNELEEDETQEENSEENYVYTIREGNTQDHGQELSRWRSGLSIGIYI